MTTEQGRPAARSRWRRAGGCLAALVWAGSGCLGPGPGASRRQEALASLERTPWEDPEAVVVSVNGRPITRGEFYRRVLRHLGTMEILSGVVKEELFLQEAERLGITVAGDEAETRAGKILEEEAEKVGGMKELVRLYERQGLSLEDLRRDLNRKVRSEILVGKVTMALREVDDAALREHYQKTYRNRRHVTSHILYSYLPPPDRPQADVVELKKAALERARRAVERLRAGADFETLARMESDDPVSARQGGLLGPVSEDSPLPAIFKEVIFSLAPGEVSDPVENPLGGYHLFKVNEIVPSESFADCAYRMKRELIEREPDLKEIQETLERLRRRSEIRFYYEELLGGGGGPEATPAARTAGP